MKNLKCKVLALCMGASIFMCEKTFSQVPSYVPSNGLVGWWPFNGNANDESGNGNNGTNNGATLTNDRFGNTDNSYLFDGISNRIAFNLNSINNSLPASSESTSSIWIKTTDLNGPLISMQGNNGIEYDFHIGTLADVVQNPGYYGILVRDNCCGSGNNSFASNCIDNSWHMLSIIRLANGTLVVSNASISNNNQQFRCIVNNAGCVDTSDIAVLTVSTAGMNELSVQGNINLYPNPTQSSFEIQTNLVYSKIEIRDMQGRIVKTENAGKTITIASLQKGTYLVQLLDEKSKVIAVQQIIKE